MVKAVAVTEVVIIHSQIKHREQQILAAVEAAAVIVVIMVEMELTEVQVL